MPRPPGKWIWAADASSRCKAGLTAWICGAMRTATSALAVVMDYKSGGKKLDTLLVQTRRAIAIAGVSGALRHWKNPREFFGVDKIDSRRRVLCEPARPVRRAAARATEVLGDADEARKLAYRHNGRFDASVLRQAGSRQSRRPVQLPADTNGRLVAQIPPRRCRARNLTHCSTAWRRSCARMGRAIFSGVAKVDPYRKGTRDAVRILRLPRGVPD